MKAGELAARGVEVAGASGFGVAMTALCVVVVVELGHVPAETAMARSPAPASIEVVPPPPPPEPMLEPTMLEEPLASAADDPLPQKAEPPPPSPVASVASHLSVPSIPGGLGVLPPLGEAWATPARAADEAGSAEAIQTTPAAVLHRPAPRYPAVAQRQGIEGHVIVRLRVEADGVVSDVVIVDAEPAGVFDAVARETALRYRFRPARRGTAAVATTVEQRILFRLTR